METERELFEDLPHIKSRLDDVFFIDEENTYLPHQWDDADSVNNMHFINGAWYSWQARVPEGYVVVPCNPTEEMWEGLSRHLVKYMQSHDRYYPKTLGKYISRFIGFKNIPDWLNKEVPDWESDHAFATADLGVFIYKAMIGAAT